MFMLGDKVRRNVLVSCDHGLMVVNRFDSNPQVGIGGFLLKHGNNNTVEADFTFKVLQGIENPIVIDVGANIGTYATWIAHFLDKDNGKIYCFEPQREVFQILCANFAINNIFNAYAYELALGSEEKFVEINEVDYNQQGSFGAFTLTDVTLPEGRITKLPTKQRIKMTTLDKFVEDYQLPKVDFIKIDAEGLDIEVMDGAKNIINMYKPDLYVEYLNLGSTGVEDSSVEGRDRLINYLSPLGYKCMVVGHDIFATCRDILKQAE